MKITIELLYEIAHNEIRNEFGIDRFGQEVDRWADDVDCDTELYNAAFDVEIDGESIATIIEVIIDDMIGGGLLKTRKSQGGIIEVYRQ